MILPDMLNIVILFNNDVNLYAGGTCAFVKLNGCEFAALGTSREHAAAEVLKLLSNHLEKKSS